jgi:hypothetical protein
MKETFPLKEDDNRTKLFAQTIKEFFEKQGFFTLFQFVEPYIFETVYHGILLR